MGIFGEMIHGIFLDGGAVGGLYLILFVGWVVFFGNLGFSWMGYRCGRPWCLEDGMSCFEASAFHTLNLLILCRNGGLGEGDMNWQFEWDSMVDVAMDWCLDWLTDSPALLSDTIGTVEGTPPAHWRLVRHQADFSVEISSARSEDPSTHRVDSWYVKWVWINTYENTIFNGMNIHKSQLFWCELQGYYWFWHTAKWCEEWVWSPPAVLPDIPRYTQIYCSGVGTRTVMTFGDRHGPTWKPRPYHTARIYIFGENVPRDPWRLSLQVPEELRQYIDERRRMPQEALVILGDFVVTKLEVFWRGIQAGWFISWKILLKRLNMDEK